MKKQLVTKRRGHKGEPRCRGYLREERELNAFLTLFCPESDEKLGFCSVFSYVTHFLIILETD